MAEEGKATKKVLFMTNSEYGQANVILAVAYELLLRDSYDVHIASFGPLERRVAELNERISSMSKSPSSTAKFHLIIGPSAHEAGEAKMRESNTFIGPFPPGIHGAKDTYRTTLPAMALVWDNAQYMAGYASCTAIIDSLKPNLVACDPLMSQGLEACTLRSCNVVVLSPNTFREILGKQQPLSYFFRYPALASAFPYPVPWYLILANIYLKITLLWILLSNLEIKALVAFRKSQNLPKLPPPFDIWKPEYHYLVPALPETDFPAKLTSNITPCGPILLPEPPVQDTDPKMLKWLKQGPTVLINLGSHIRMDDAMAREFASALKVMLDARPDVQVLWKLKKVGGISLRSAAGDIGAGVTNESLESIEEHVESGRVRIEEWLSVDPVAVLQSGHVACSVHHGGSNSYHEALSVGAPQIILPCWMDTFDFANRVEYLKIGVFGSRKHCPGVEAKELTEAFMRVMGEGHEAALIAAKAKELAVIAGKVGGRVKACEKIIELLEET